MNKTDPVTQPPDVIAHKFVTNTGDPVRIYPVNGTLSIPIEPYRSGRPATTDIPVQSFDAVVERASIEDGGVNLVSFGGIHLPSSEWKRVGLRKHWEADDVDLRDPLVETQRRLELWSSREDNFHSTDIADYRYDHLDPLPDDSPLLTTWTAYTDDAPEKPPVPFPQPTLTVYVVHAEDANPDARGCDRVQIGEIAGIKILDDIDEWPKEPNIDKRELDISLPSRHPSLDYDALDPLPHTEEVLAAVHAINRHAKRLDKDADHAYESGQGAEARVHSLRKKALYKTKTVAVHRLAKTAPADTRIVLHELNGTHEMYCFYFGDGYSFHQPLAAVEDAVIEDVPSTATDEPTEIEFEPSAQTDTLDVSLGDALRTLADHGINANAYLNASVVEDYDWGYMLSTVFDCLPEDSSN